MKQLIATIVLALVLTACHKEEIDREVEGVITKQFTFKEPTVGIEHLLEIRGDDAELLVKSGECYRPTRDGDFINVELVVINTLKEGVEMDVINNENVTRIFVRISDDVAEIPFNGVAIHAPRVKRPWLIYKCN